jgi:hypothetical protein
MVNSNLTTETAKETTKDVFSIYAKSFDKVHGAIEKSSPQLLQSMTNLHQEYLATWSNFVNSTLAIQQQYATKIGVNTTAPETTTNVVNEITDGLVKMIDANNKMVQTALDATRQNFKTINDNATAYAELGQNVIQSWIGAFRARN